jgi:hypothetical protein
VFPSTGQFWHGNVPFLTNKNTVDNVDDKVDDDVFSGIKSIWKWTFWESIPKRPWHGGIDAAVGSLGSQSDLVGTAICE